MIFDLQFCTGMAKGIPDLSRMAGIAGLINPSSNFIERLIKEHKYEIFQIETGVCNKFRANQDNVFESQCLLDIPR